MILHPNYDGSNFRGRRLGRPLRPHARKLLSQHLALWSLNLASPPPPDLRTLFTLPIPSAAMAGRPSPLAAIWAEIGCGSGEHLLAEARRRPDIGHIAIEPFRPGIAKILRAVVGEGLTNIRLHAGDAHEVLLWLARQSRQVQPDISTDDIDQPHSTTYLQRVNILFPDPWPKKRHWKRRFINSQNVRLLAEITARRGQLRFASDSAEYAEQAVEIFSRRPDDWEWTASCARDWRQPPPYWPGTRYSSKALAAGRPLYFLNFERC